jgi:arylsulfatase A-like enzyme
MLGDEGFRTAGIVANVHLSPQMGFSDGYGLWRYAHSGDAADQVDHALSWLQSHSEEDSFLFLHFMDPHIFYMAPEPWTDRFTEGEPPEELADRYNRRTIERLEARGLLDERTQNFIEGRYSGEIGYLDSELGRLVEAVDALPGETTIVVLSDHGEEFWEHGGFEHNHSLYQELTRALLWIRPPRGQLTDGPYRVTADVSLADLAPTLLDLLGSNSPRPPLDGLSLLPLLQGDHPTRARLASELSSRRLPMGHLMYGTERWGVVQERHKYILHRANGEQELFDLRADPGEQNNLAGTANLSTWWTALEDATGYPTGSGWRVEISQLRAPLRLHMAQPIRAAEVIDPESKRSRRSNQEWGESPVLQSADVATLSLSEDGRVLEIEPGVHGRGTLALLGDPGQVQVMDEEGQMQGEPLEADQSLRLPGGPSLVSSTGVVILAGETESLHPAVSAEADQREALQSLGYLE